MVIAAKQRVRKKAEETSPQSAVLFRESTALEQAELLDWAAQAIAEHDLEEHVYLQTCCEIAVDVDRMVVGETTLSLHGTVPIRYREAYLQVSSKLCKRVRDLDTNVKLQLSEGDLAPEIELYDEDGKKQLLFGCAKRHRRRVVVLFWSTASGGNVFMNAKPQRYTSRYLSTWLRCLASLVPLMDLESFASNTVECVAVSVDSK